ncbi:MAG: alpha-amylase family glycosyl hydrolase, partial [bacterium]|nr:alpha-amylase family glycosyl hydrolase [bacterium]
VADWSDVADLDYRQKGVRQYMIEVMKFWVSEADIDGYRCDVAAMIPTDFWVEAREELERIKPVFMLAGAETPELNAFGFDMTYASKMHHTFNAIARGRSSAVTIDQLLRFEFYHYPSNSMRMRFTSNHDENSWNGSAITRMTRGGAKAGAVLCFTLPGNPLIYNGQEVGNEKALAFFEKDPIIWQENEFRVFYQKLARTYQSHPALYDGQMTKLNSEDDDAVYAFVREKGEDSVMVVVNFSPKPFWGHVDLNGVCGQFEELFSRNQVEFNGDQHFFSLDGWDYKIFILVR